MSDATMLAAGPPELSIHIIAASLALGLGPFAIYRRRRDLWHKATGYVWVVAIAVTALSSFLIPASIFPIALGMGAIHLLSIWALWTICFGVLDARAGRIADHRSRMAGLYWQGLTVAGALTLLPGRVLNETLFGQRPEIGLWLVLGFGAVGLLSLGRRWRRAPDPPKRDLPGGRGGASRSRRTGRAR